jgi:hypothetical protein
MSLLNWRTCFQRFGLFMPRASRRIPKLRSGWGTESEQLENRALLSAGRHRAMAVDRSVAAEVRQESRKAQPVQFPNVQGTTWNLAVTSEYVGNGTVTMQQSGRGGKKVVSTITIEDLPTFTTTATFKKKSPNELNSKSPRIEVPGVPIDLRVEFTIRFPNGEPNPTTFNGSASVVFVGTIATFEGTKA